MKNIQELLLQCGGVGKLILGDEEIDISVTDIKSKLQKIDGFRDCCGKQHEGENMIATYLEIGLWGDDFCRVAGEKQ